MPSARQWSRRAAHWRAKHHCANSSAKIASAWRARAASSAAGERRASGAGHSVHGSPPCTSFSTAKSDQSRSHSPSRARKSSSSAEASALAAPHPGASELGAVRVSARGDGEIGVVEPPLALEHLERDEEGAPGARRERLVRRVAEPGRSERQHLPEPLPREREPARKAVRGRAEVARAVRARQRGGMEQDPAPPVARLHARLLHRWWIRSSSGVSPAPSSASPPRSSARATAPRAPSPTASAVARTSPPTTIVKAMVGSDPPIPTCWSAIAAASTNTIHFTAHATSFARRIPWFTAPMSTPRSTKRPAPIPPSSTIAPTTRRGRSPRSESPRRLVVEAPRTAIAIAKPVATTTQNAPRATSQEGSWCGSIPRPVVMPHSRARRSNPTRASEKRSTARTKKAATIAPSTTTSIATMPSRSSASTAPSLPNASSNTPSTRSHMAPLLLFFLMIRRPPRDEVRLLRLERLAESLDPLLGGRRIERRHLVHVGRDPAEVERRQRAQELLAVHRLDAPAYGEVVHDAGPEPVGNAEALGRLARNPLERVERLRREHRPPYPPQVLRPAPERRDERPWRGWVSGVVRQELVPVGRDRARAADALPARGVERHLVEHRPEDVREGVGDVGRLRLRDRAGPEEHLGAAALAHECLRDDPQVGARVARVRPPFVVAGEVFGQPPRHRQLAPERLADPLAEQGARERVDEPRHEDAVEAPACVGRSDEVRVAAENRIEQRTQPARVRRARHRLEERARGRAERQRHLEERVERRLRVRAAAGVDRRSGRARLGDGDGGARRERPLRIAREHQREGGAARERGAEPRLHCERRLRRGGAIALRGDANHHVGAERLVRSRRFEHDRNVGRRDPRRRP